MATRASGARAVDPATGVFDANHGRDALERLFADSSVELMTLNGTASVLVTAGARGPRPLVKIYSKAHNALIREWPVCALILRLIDSATLDVTPSGEPIEKVGGAAKPPDALKARHRTATGVSAYARKALSSL